MGQVMVWHGNVMLGSRGGARRGATRRGKAGLDRAVWARRGMAQLGMAVSVRLVLAVCVCVG